MPSSTTRSILLAVTAAVALCAPVHAADEARELVERVAAAVPDVPFRAELTLTTAGDLQRELTISGAPLEDGGEARFIEVQAPFNIKDTRYLLLEREKGRDEQFFYLPTMQRVMRLSEVTRREPFLGSTFYIVDLLQPSVDEYRYAFVGNATLEGRKCRLVEARPVNPADQLYGRTVWAIDPEDLVVVRADLFDADDEPFKRLYVEELELIDDHWTPMRQRMVNRRDGSSSLLETVEIEYDAELPEEIFTVGHLGR